LALVGIVCLATAGYLTRGVNLWFCRAGSPRIHLVGTITTAICSAARTFTVRTWAGASPSRARSCR
jgi:hypothetical protein